MQAQGSSGRRPLALVTGASSGIGAAFAERLARDGYDLVAVARRRDRLDELAARLGPATGAAVEPLVADLEDEAGVRAVEARLGGDDRLALLVNNAGFSGYGPFVELEPAVLDGLIGVHIRAVARLARAAAPGMVARRAGGIINLASLLAFAGSFPPDPMPHRATYTGAKAFVVGFTQALASELAPAGVRVMVVCPGVVATEFHGGRPQRRPEMTPADVVSAALAGLAQGEVICVPGLEDAAAVSGLVEAQRALFSAGVSPTLAARYRDSATGQQA